MLEVLPECPSARNPASKVPMVLVSPISISLGRRNGRINWNGITILPNERKVDAQSYCRNNDFKIGYLARHGARPRSGVDHILTSALLKCKRALFYFC